MSVYETFQQSNAWDDRYKLPLSPQNNNPHIYTAWATKIIAHHMLIPMEHRENIENYIEDCELEPGLFNRWPDGSGGVTSHDELIGIALHSRSSAVRILKYLQANDWYYNNTTEPEPAPGYWDLSKFGWFKAFIKARALIKPGFVTQMWWCLHVLWHAFTTKADTDNASGLLLIWTMMHEMDLWPACGLANDIFRWRMRRIGVTPRKMLALEPRENPVFAELGPEEW